MSAPGFPVDEAERLLALQRTALLDTPPEERFDRITRLAAHFFAVQTCLLSLIDSDRQWFKSRVGLEQQELRRDISFCGHAILDRGILMSNGVRCVILPIWLNTKSRASIRLSSSAS